MAMRFDKAMSFGGLGGRDTLLDVELAARTPHAPTPAADAATIDAVRSIGRADADLQVRIDTSVWSATVDAASWDLGHTAAPAATAAAPSVPVGSASGLFTRLLASEEALDPALADLSMAVALSDAAYAAGTPLATTMSCACIVCDEPDVGVASAGGATGPMVTTGHTHGDGGSYACCDGLEPDPGRTIGELTDDSLMVALDDLAAPLPNASISTQALYLRQGFWDWFGGANYRSFNMGSSGTGANNGTLYYNYAGFSGISGAGTDSNGLTTARRALVDDALDHIGEVLGINFVATTATDTTVDIFFKDNDSGAYANSTLFGSGNGTTNHRYIDYSWVNVNSTWSGGTSDINDYTYQTIIHEIFHALGLGHAGAYNGTATYITDSTQATSNNNVYLNDSWQMSIMSYIDQVENTQVNASFSYVITGMAADWYALQTYYGTSAFTGNTIYGFNTNISTAVSEVMANLSLYADETTFNIIDNGGVDTLDFSGYSANQLINLTNPSTGSLGSVSNIGGLIGNMTIAAGTVIENAYGGSGNDTLLGNTANNDLEGRGGNDSIDGGDGNDTVDGGTGADTMSGGFGDDLYIVDNAGDVAAEVAGGIDTVQSSVTHTLSVNLENLTLTGTANINGTGNDSRANVIVGNSGANLLSGLGLDDNLSGGSGDDTLLGGTGNDTLAGGSGVDSVNGGDGDDLILFTSGHFYDDVDGGAGTDTLDATAVNRNGDTFDFKLGIISGYPGGQTVTGIEVFLGGQGDETIVSSGTGGSYFGNAGNDLMIAEVGSETMDGGAGIDTIDLSRWNGAYTVDMVSGSSNYGGELYVNFENLVSGAGDDSITGTAGANDIRTDGGNDTVVAGGGEDTVYGGDGNDLLQGGFVTDFIYGEAGDDVIQVLAGEYYDNVDGGDGFDTLDHSASAYAGNTFDFEAQLITGPNVNAPAFLRSIELYQDGSGGNSIVSDGNGNTYLGNGGDDYMTAELGAETMDGGVGGIDTIDLTRWGGDYVVDMTTGSSNYTGELYTNFENLLSGAGNDSITGTGGSNNIATGSGNDTVNAGAGTDTVSGGNGNDTFVDTQTMTVGDNDVYDGGGGTDTLVHDLTWASSVTFNLDTGFATVSGSNRDQFISIENLIVGGEATVIGSAADNVLTVNGTGANSISGLAGNDQIFAGGGNDTVSGGDGNDSIEGGQGTDNIDAGNGDDAIRILDGEFIDNIVGGAGTDTLNMTAVTTAIVFNALTGTYQGSVAGDAARTHTGIEIFRSGSAGDAIYSNGSGEYHGNGGNDTMYAGLGTPEVLDGGDGIDTLDTTSFGGGFAYSLDMNTGLTNYAGELFTNFENLIMGSTVDTVVGTAGDNNIRTLEGNDSVTAGSGDDFVDGGDGNDSLVGGDGNDTLEGNTGADTMEGGAGNDVFHVDDVGDAVTDASGTDTVISSITYALGAGLENLTLVGSATDGTGNGLDNVIQGNGTANGLYGLAGNDTLLGGGGMDWLDGGSGADSMEGGDGSDVYVVDNVGDVVVEVDTAAGGTSDTVHATISYTLGTGLEFLGLFGGTIAIDGTGNEKDNIIVGNDGSNVLSGLEGNDSLEGAAGDDTLLGGNGNDTLDGEAGADLMSGNDGDDTYYVDDTGDVVLEEYFETGNDTVFSTLGFYQLTNYVENLTLLAGAVNGKGNNLANVLTGNDGDNLLEGANSIDTLYGGLGNDTLDGGAGADSMEGGLGDDTYVITTSTDVVVELPGQGIDTVRSLSTAFYTLPDNVENYFTFLTTGTLGGVGNALDNFMGGSGANDNFSGLDGNDTLNGGPGNDTMIGGNGNDSLGGGAGNDSLVGGAGNDLINGGGDNDTLAGGSGNDTMNGGAGDDDYQGVAVGDIISEGANQGYDRVFANGNTTLGNNFEYLELLTGSSGTGNVLDNTLVGNTANNTLSGLAGADTLQGKAGNDALYAGVDADADRFLFDTALDAATNVDTLYESDFPEDQIWLANDVFSALLSTGGTNTGTLGAGFYFEGSGINGNGASDAIGIWYDLATGSLYYNPTAGTAGDSTLFAIIDGASAAVDAADFTLWSGSLAAAGDAGSPLGLQDDDLSLSSPAFFTTEHHGAGYSVV